tara:strand:- start:8620 stop:9765 length:1146 start_codon:yes stop_codon:yes gene_type:complete
MMVTGKYSGELDYFYLNISKFEVAALYFLTALGFIFLFIYYKVTKKKDSDFSIGRWVVLPKRFNVAFFLILLGNIAFFINTKVGLAGGGGGESKYSIIFAPLKVQVIFFLFYIFCRKSPEFRFLFWVNVVLFIIFSLMQGWTSFFLTIAIFELHFFFQFKRISLPNRILIICFAPLLLFLLGGAVYKEAYPYKFEARGQSVSDLGYLEAVDKLVTRLSFFPISVGVYEKNQEVTKLYDNSSISFKELRGAFRQILPRFLMEQKEFRSLNNNAVQAFMPDLTAHTSSSFGFLIYGVTLFSISIFEGILWLLMSVFSIFILKYIFDSLEQYPGQFNILYFLLILKLYRDASFESVFGDSYAYLLYILPVFIIFGVIKRRRVEV